MDNSVQQITEYYEEQLTNLLAARRVNGERMGTTLDHALFAHVHSFFMHLGAARDYLATLIAIRLGKNPKSIDSMGRLIPVIRSQHFGSEPLLELLRSRQYIEPSRGSPHRWEISGWLKNASDLRNAFVHKRPYGDRQIEKAGTAVPILAEAGLYRYFRSVVIEERSDQDVLDMVHSHYRQSTALFLELAEASGGDTSIFTFTDEDIIGFRGETTPSGQA